MKGSMIGKMPGEMADKFGNLRVAYGFMTAHPGKKLLFMGQDFAQIREWSEERSIDWFLLDNEPDHRELNNYYRDLLHFIGASRRFMSRMTIKPVSCGLMAAIRSET